MRSSAALLTSGVSRRVAADGDDGPGARRIVPLDAWLFDAMRVGTRQSDKVNNKCK